MRIPETLTGRHKEVITSLARNGMCVSRTARELYMHRNSVLYNAPRIKLITGKNLLNFFDLYDLVRMVEEAPDAD